MQPLRGIGDLGSPMNHLPGCIATIIVEFATMVASQRDMQSCSGLSLVLGRVLQVKLEVREYLSNLHEHYFNPVKPRTIE